MFRHNILHNNAVLVAVSDADGERVVPSARWVTGGEISNALLRWTINAAAIHGSVEEFAGYKRANVVAPNAVICKYGAPA